LSSVIFFGAGPIPSNGFSSAIFLAPLLFDGDAIALAGVVEAFVATALFSVEGGGAATAAAGGVALLRGAGAAAAGAFAFARARIAGFKLAATFAAAGVVAG
jgi:hypothetical protein